MIIDPNAAGALDQIVQHLRDGELVAIPTETVYGLAADASNPEAIAKIFQLKNRPLHNPLIVHLAEVEQISDWADHIPDVAWQLAKVFWPGPLTLILPKAKKVNTLLTAGQETVGLRIPAHPVAHKILTAFAGGLAAPSANPFMSLSPTTAQHVADFFPDNLWVVEGGATTVGLESTIIDCSSTQAVILRSGMITPELIKVKTGLNIDFATQTHVKHAGQHKVHYAPKTLLRLYSSAQLDQALMTSSKTNDIGLLLYKSRELQNYFKQVICLSEQAVQYAKNFYAALHQLDDVGCREIWVEVPPEGDEWRAIHERLIKAAAKFE